MMDRLIDVLLLTFFGSGALLYVTNLWDKYRAYRARKAIVEKLKGAFADLAKGGAPQWILPLNRKEEDDARDRDQD